MKFLLIFVSVVCAAHAKIVIQVIQEVENGCGNCEEEEEEEGGGGGGGGGGVNLDNLADQLGALNNQLNELNAQADAADAAGQAAQDALDAINTMLSSLPGGGSSGRRRHRRNAVTYANCDPDVSLSGDAADVLVSILDAIVVELDSLATTLDATKLNCYIETLGNINNGITNGTVTLPADVSAITASGSAAGAAAVTAKTAVGDAAASIAASIADVQTQLEETQAAIEQAGGTVPVTTETNNQTTAVLDCDYSAFTMEHTMLQEANCSITSSGVTDEEISIILSKHNTLRAKVARGDGKFGDPGPQPNAANMREIVWNEELARVAQAMANQCLLEEECADCRKVCSRNYSVGQNMYYLVKGDSSSFWNDSIDSWYERINIMPNIIVGSFSNDTLPLMGINPYTQLVWAETYEVGCGRVHFSMTLDGAEFPEVKKYVCNYGPAGNILDAPVYIEGTPASQCPDNQVSETYPDLCA